MAMRTVRAGNLLGVEALIEDLEGSSAAVLVAAGASPDALADPEMKLSYRLANRILVEAARATRSDFALRLAARQGPAVLGRISRLIDTAPTVGHALSAITESFALHNQGSRADLNVYDDFVLWSLTVEETEVEAWHHADLAAGVSVRILRYLIGPEWSPEEVWLSHRAPDHSDFYQARFRTTVRFDAERNAVMLKASDMSQPVFSGDPERYRDLLEDARRKLSASKLSFSASVIRAIWEALADNIATLEYVADTLGLDRRTLQRRLALENLTFRDALKTVRRTLADQYITETNIPLATIALILCYSDQTAFTRAYRKASGGTTPAAKRRSVENSTFKRLEHQV